MPHLFNGEQAILRLTFRDPSKESEELKLITWESFFAQFDLLDLVFMYEPDEPQYELLRIQEKTAPNVEVRPN